MATENILKKEYDFTGKDPNAILTEDEFEYFDEGMALKNTADPSDQIDFARGVQSVVKELDKLLP